MPQIKVSGGGRQRADEQAAPSPTQLKSNLRGKSFAEQQSALAPGASKGGGEALPEAVRAKMERGFGADFAGVRVHEDGDQAAALGAQAYTQGDAITFAPGRYQPDTEAGQELIGHELTHVIQQRAGRVAPQGRGGEVVGDRGLEREADVMGARVAAGRAADVQGATQGPSNGGDAVQCFREIDGSDTDTDMFASHKLPSGEMEVGDELYKKEKQAKMPPLRLSDDGRMAVENTGNQAQVMFGTGDVIAKANSKLGSNGSPLRLKEEGGEITPGDHTLKRAVPKKEGAEDKEFSVGKHHCDEFANEISNMSTSLAFNEETEEGKKLAQTPLSYLDQTKDSHTVAATIVGGTKVPDKDKIRGSEKVANKTVARYGSMDPTEKSKRSEKAGINEYADKNMKPGESIGTYSVSSSYDGPNQKLDYTQLPEKERKEVSKKGDFKLKWHASKLKREATKLESKTKGSVDHVKKKTWTFHYATAVARSGADWMSFENYNRFSEASEGLSSVWAKVREAHNGLLSTVEEVGTKEKQLEGAGGQKQYALLVQLLRKAASTLLETQREASEAITQTLQSYSLNHLWFFQMYGPASKGQSYHQQQEASKGFANPLTMRRRAKTKGPLEKLPRQDAIDKLRKDAEPLAGNEELKEQADEVIRRATEVFNPGIEDTKSDGLTIGKGAKLLAGFKREIADLVRQLPKEDDVEKKVEDVLDEVPEEEKKEGGVNDD